MVTFMLLIINGSHRQVFREKVLGHGGILASRQLTPGRTGRQKRIGHKKPKYSPESTETKQRIEAVLDKSQCHLLIYSVIRVSTERRAMT